MSNLHPYNFFFELPLYTRIMVDNTNVDDFLELMRLSGGVDAYNPILKENSTYRVALEWYMSGRSNLSAYRGFNKFVLTCVRNGYTITYFVHLEIVEDHEGNEEYFFQKVGQLPSIADIHISKIREYDKVLEREKIREVTRAIGLAANGVGIGSFVYLRRVFEDLVEEAHQIAIKGGTLNEVEYSQARMVEKIALLRNYLPEFLVTNKSIYSILSLGIHELNEQDCLKHFEALKVGIELILDEKIESLAKQTKIDEAQRRIQAITQQLKGK